jgi:hypothetical protein
MVEAGEPGLWVWRVLPLGACPYKAGKVADAHSKCLPVVAAAAAAAAAVVVTGVGCWV